MSYGQHFHTNATVTTPPNTHVWRHAGRVYWSNTAPRHATDGIVMFDDDDEEAEAEQFADQFGHIADQ